MSSANSDGLHAEIFLTSDAATLAATSAFAQPMPSDARSEMRWLLEDRPRLRSTAAEAITRRIEGRLRDIGENFGDAVFGGPGAEAMLAALPADRSAVDVRIVYDSDTAALPWELLRIPAADRALACEARSFVRWHGDGTSVVEHGEHTESALRVLLVVSRPGGEEDVPFRSVASRVVAAVCAPESAIRVDILRPPTFAALTDRLDRAKSAGVPYHVVHFDGHGIFRPSPFSPKKMSGALRFETAADNSESISGKAFGAALLAGGVRIAILNACRSGFADGSQATPFASLAADIVAQGVDAVMAMGFDVYVVTAAAIVADVYAALAAGRTLGEAVTFARQRLAKARTDLDWVVPVAHERELVRLLDFRDAIRILEVGPNAATPAGPVVVDLAGADGPRSAQRPFFGYDGALLGLDRALGRDHIVEIVGVAGSGKSAVAAESARWIAFTSEKPSAGGNALPVMAIDVARCADRAALESAISDALEALPIPLATLPNVWVFDDADTLLAGDGPLPKADRDALVGRVRDLAKNGSDVILTGRASSLIEGVTSVTLSGLDSTALADLMTAYGLTPAEDGDVLAAWLDWTQGLPGLVLAPLPHTNHQTAQEPLAALRRSIRNIRLGDALAEPLAAACGLKKLLQPNFSETTIMALFNFQGYLTRELWEFFAQYLAFKTNGILGGERYAWDTLRAQMRGAMRGGFVSPLADATLFLHPLATFAITPHYYEMCRAMAGPEPPERHRLWTLGLPIAAFCTSLITALPLAKLGGMPPTMRPRLLRQNVLAAAEPILENHWWHYANLLREASHALRAEQRHAEAAQLLAQIETALSAHPPTADDGAVEDPIRLIAQLQAEDAQHRGDSAEAERMNVERDALAYAERAKQIVKDGKVITDIGAIQVIALMLRRGDKLRLANDPAALDILLQALDLARETHDIVRTGEIQLAIARVYRNVDALRDCTKYEAYAREAARTAEQIESVAPDLLPRAKASLGTAITDRLTAESIATQPDRVGEARAALLLAAARGDVETQAIARNSLAILENLAGNKDAAIDSALKAAELFAAVSAAGASVTCYCNAALGLLQMDRYSDVAATAAEGLRVARTGNIHGEAVDTLVAIARQAAVSLERAGAPKG